MNKEKLIQIDQLSLKIDFKDELTVDAIVDALQSFEKLAQIGAKCYTEHTNITLKDVHLVIGNIKQGSFDASDFKIVANSVKSLLSGVEQMEYKKLLTLCIVGTVCFVGYMYAPASGGKTVIGEDHSINLENSEININQAEQKTQESLINKGVDTETARNIILAIRHLSNEDRKEARKSIGRLSYPGGLQSKGVHLERRDGERALETYMLLEKEVIDNLQEIEDEEDNDEEALTSYELKNAYLDIRLVNKDGKSTGAMKCIVTDGEDKLPKKNLLIPNDADREWVIRNNTKEICANIRVYCKPNTRRKAIVSYEITKLYKRKPKAQASGKVGEQPKPIQQNLEL